jgi:glycine cleavage system regulatory protein
MNLSLVLTVLADDKPGIVEQLSSVINQNQGNWLESRMASLAGKFAGILHISVEDSHADNLLADLAALSGKGIEVRAERGNVPHGKTVHLTLNLVGNDRPGIVRELSQVLAGLNVNVLELTTDCGAAEMSAVPLFRAEAELEVPTDFDQQQLSDAIEAISNDLMVDISLN